MRKIQRWVMDDRRRLVAVGTSLATISSKLKDWELVQVFLLSWRRWDSSQCSGARIEARALIIPRSWWRTKLQIIALENSSPLVRNPNGGVGESSGGGVLTKGGGRPAWRRRRWHGGDGEQLQRRRKNRRGIVGLGSAVPGAISAFFNWTNRICLYIYGKTVSRKKLESGSRPLVSSVWSRGHAILLHELLFIHFGLAQIKPDRIEKWPTGLFLLFSFPPFLCSFYLFIY